MVREPRGGGSDPGRANDAVSRVGDSSVISIVGVFVVVGASVFGVSATPSPSSTAPTETLWPSSFAQGMSPLVGVGPLPSSASCASCHPDEFAQWQGSRHRAAATNDVFIDGLRAEPHQRCVNCHAPAPQAARDLTVALTSSLASERMARRAQLAQPKASPVTASLASLPKPSAAHDGISCAICHVRDGVVVGAGSGRGYGHDVRVDAELKRATFCAACHEFVGHDVVDGVTTLNALPMQSTYSEWRAWRERSGDSRTCQHCHMPQGRHDFDGSSLPLLRRSLDVSFQGRGSSVVAVVAAVDVGHSFPTGDVFRHITVWAERGDGRRQPLFRFERRTALVDDGGGATTQIIAADTRLRPGEAKDVPVPADADTIVVTYHRADDAAEARGRVSYDELVVEVLRLEVRR